MARFPLILAVFTFNSHANGKDVKSTNPVVYCPCLHKETCTGRYGDKVPCDDTQNHCTGEDSIIKQGHYFVEKDGSIAEGFNLTDLRRGSHCRVSIEFITYWLGDKVQEERPWRSRFSKYILPSLEYDEHRLNKWTSLDDEDSCRNDASDSPISENDLLRLFPNKHVPNEYDRNPDRYNTPKTYYHCVPSSSEYERMRKEVGNGTEIPQWYLDLFNGTLSPKFEQIFDKEIDEEIASRKYPFYKRRNFWIISACLAMFFLTIHLIIKQIRKMVAYVRTGLINNIEQPELLEYSITPENILGEGGCGRVYAGRFRGNNVAIKVIDIYSDSKKAERLKMECLILHTLNQHRNEFILQIYSPNLEVVATADRLEEIVLTKYGWDNNKRNLDDLLMEIRDRSILPPTHADHWDNGQVIQIVWHIVSSLIQGLRQIHFPPKWPTDAPEFIKYVECVVHRDIKNKNIGVKKTPDGTFCCVIADFGLSSICINDLGRDYLKRKQQSCFPIGNMKNTVKQITPHFEWLKYFSDNNEWNNKALEFIKKEEERQTGYFTRHIAPGTNRWRAPEIVYSCKDYFFKLSNDHHCKLGCLDKSDNEAGRLLEKDVCGKCTREIFRFYRMNDVYGVGLVIFNILKTVSEKELMQSQNYTNSEIQEFIENPDEVGTSREPSITTDGQRDEFDEFLPEKMLEYIQRQAIRMRLDYEPHLRCIRNIAEQCLRPNPYDRPEINEICDELTAFDSIRQNTAHWPPSYNSLYNDKSPPTATTVLTK